MNHSEQFWWILFNLEATVISVTLGSLCPPKQELLPCTVLAATHMPRRDTILLSMII